MTFLGLINCWHIVTRASNTKMLFKVFQEIVLEGFLAHLLIDSALALNAELEDNPQ